MKNLFLINEDERNRILNLHETATKNQYLTEQSDELTKSAKRIAAKLINSAETWEGTDEEGLVATMQEIKDINMFNLVNGLIPTYSKGMQGPYGGGKYVSIVDVLNGEFGEDDLNSVQQIFNHLKSIGITMTYQDDVNSDGDDIYKENSIKITVPKATAAPAASKSVDETFKNFPCVPTLANKKGIKMDSNGSFLIGNFRYFGNGRKGDTTTKKVLNYTCNDAEFKTSTKTAAAGTTKPKASAPTDTDLDNFINTYSK